METSKDCKDFIKSYESLHDGDLSMAGLQPKLDGAGIWTEGWGHAMKDENGNYRRVEDYPTLNDILPYQTIWTVEEANKVFEDDVAAAARMVDMHLKIFVSQQQFDAL